MTYDFLKFECHFLILANKLSPMTRQFFFLNWIMQFTVLYTQICTL